MTLTYRHWFFLALMLLLNVSIFGCFVLSLFGKVYLG